MRVGFVAAGIGLISFATFLLAVGHYDGILGSTPAAALPAPGNSGYVTARVIVEGAPQTLAELYGVAPSAVAQEGAEARYVPARLDEPGGARVLLAVGDAAPTAGAILVVQGRAEGFRLTEEGPAVLVLEPEEIREPIFFKDA